jgi:RHS repeat-associated protein
MYQGCRPFPVRPTSGTSYVVPQEPTYFRYDLLGRMVYASNPDAEVKRSYLPGGAMSSDTLRLRAYGGVSMNSGYGIEYGYDILGRMRRMVHPADLAGPAQVDTFAYDPVTGALTWARDRIGNALAFGYDVAGRPVSTRPVGYTTNAVDSTLYDVGGRVQRRMSGTTSSPASTEDAYLYYDARGKLVRADLPNGTASTHRNWYSGLGNLVATEWDNDAGPGYEREDYAMDALGNIRQQRAIPSVSDYPHDYYMEYQLHPTIGRVQAMIRRDMYAQLPDTEPHDSTTRHYDASGNMDIGTQMSNMGGSVRYRMTRNYYGADERLRATQVVDENANASPGVWEEYRYDPLGRRVMVRTAHDVPVSANYPNAFCAGATQCLSTITRFVWAGDQLLWELRAPGAEGSNLEATDGTGLNYGRVSYFHAGGIDRPLSIWKNSVGSVLPHENWRGAFWQGTWGADKGTLRGLSSDCPYGGAPNCVPVSWPGYRTNAWNQSSRAGEPELWMGSLVDGMRDATGQQYMRNRYYDPQTGQFTQKEPIGLAGGMNAYGFAAGDPVSYSDPYGLSAWVVLFGKKYCYAYSGTTGALGINRAEARYLLMRNAPAALRAERIGSRTLQEVANLAATGEIPGGVEGLHNGPADAVRHAVWSCRMTQTLGESTATEIGDNHEESAAQPESEKTMDRHNNQVGRDIGRIRSRDCLKGALNALTSDVPGGSLQTQPEE